MLGIDDPIQWINGGSPIVIDWSIAYLPLYILREREAYDKAGGTDGKELDPSSALEKLNNMAK